MDCLSGYRGNVGSVVVIGEEEMNKIEIKIGNEQHSCKRHMEGDWEVWTCPQCPGYSRRFNHKEGLMKTTRTDRSELFTHGGMCCESPILH